MKRFEVGKCYEYKDYYGHFIEYWQCTEIIDKIATFELVGLRYTEVGGRRYKEAFEYIPQIILARIHESSYLNTETTYRYTDKFYLDACNEVSDDAEYYVICPNCKSKIVLSKVKILVDKQNATKE